MKKKLFIFSNESISFKEDKFFCDNIDKYIVETNYAKYLFLIKNFAPPELKALLVELGVLETKWTQNVRTQKRLVEIVAKFDDWCEIKGY